MHPSRAITLLHLSDIQFGRLGLPEPDEVANQYQVLRLHPDRIERYTTTETLVGLSGTEVGSVIYQRTKNGYQIGYAFR